MPTIRLYYASPHRTLLLKATRHTASLRHHEYWPLVLFRTNYRLHRGIRH